MTENTAAAPPPPPAAALAAGDIHMSALFAHVERCLPFFQGREREVSKECRLFTKFPLTLNAVLWETRVDRHDRVVVRPSKLGQLKQVFADEVAAIMVQAAKIDVGCGAPARDLLGVCLRWLDARLVDMHAELFSMDASFGRLKGELRAEICEEAFGQVEAGRTARIVTLQRELQAIGSDKMALLDERGEMLFARVVMRDLAASASASAEAEAEASAEAPAKRARSGRD